MRREETEGQEMDMVLAEMREEAEVLSTFIFLPRYSSAWDGNFPSSVLKLSANV